MRIPLVAGNWKMNGTRAEARRWAQAAAGALAAAGAGVEVAVFPPYPWLTDVAAALAAAGGGVRLGAQACAPQAAGALTGAVSAAMLKEAGCHYCLCGHSERRTLLGEDDARVAAAVAQALGADLVPVLCVGETLAEREAGRTARVVAAQLAAALDALLAGPPTWVLAYEPVWAIGTGLAATPAQAAEVHAGLRAEVAARDPAVAGAIRILYGGSVKPDNIGGFLRQEDVDGALVGGASLDPAAFAALVQAGARRDGASS